MGKGTVDEDLPNFVGLYAGAASHPEVASALESSDLVITIGTIQSDLNTAGFTYQFSKLNTIDIEYDCVAVGYAKFEKVYFKSFVPKLEQALEVEKLSSCALEIPKKIAAATAAENTTSNDLIASSSSSSTPPTEEEQDDLITHEYLWPRLSTFLRSNDILITETGTSFMGIWETLLPRNVTLINQILWSSIGYGVGAAQGAALYAREHNLQNPNSQQRVICFEGDGSFQLTCQELSTIMRLELDVIMFVIENDGYEIERWVHGPEAHYNDIQRWQYSKLPEVLTVPEEEEGGKEKKKKKVKTWKVRGRRELEELLRDEEGFGRGKGLQVSFFFFFHFFFSFLSFCLSTQTMLTKGFFFNKKKFVEMHMARGDAPKNLREFAVNAAKRNSTK